MYTRMKVGELRREVESAERRGKELSFELEATLRGLEDAREAATGATCPPFLSLHLSLPLSLSPSLSLSLALEKAPCPYRTTVIPRHSSTVGS